MTIDEPTSVPVARSQSTRRPLTAAQAKLPVLQHAASTPLPGLIDIPTLPSHVSTCNVPFLPLHRRPRPSVAPEKTSTTGTNAPSWDLRSRSHTPKRSPSQTAARDPS